MVFETIHKIHPETEKNIIYRTVRQYKEKTKLFKITVIKTYSYKQWFAYLTANKIFNNKYAKFDHKVLTPVHKNVV